MVVLNLTLNLTLIWFLKEGGLALATAISAMVQTSILFIILKKRLHLKGFGGISATVAKTVTASVVMAFVCIITLNLLPEHHGSLALKAARLFVPLPIAVITFLIAARMLRSEEFQYLYDTLVKKVKAKED